MMLNRIILKISEWLCRGLVFTLAVALIGSWTAAPCAAPTATIRVLGRVEIESDEILLGQIAAIEGSDPRWVQQLKGIVIGRAPLPGKVRHQRA